MGCERSVDREIERDKVNEQVEEQVKRNVDPKELRISLYRYSHWRKDVGWINRELESPYRAMIELKREQLSLDMSKRISDAEI
ncbi:hypothetical protein LguiA_030596 [Lonicera macranthoides]